MKPLTAEQIERVRRRVEYLVSGHEALTMMREMSPFEAMVSGFTGVRFITTSVEFDRPLRLMVEKALAVHEASLRGNTRSGRRARRVLAKSTRLQAVVDSALAVFEEDDRKPVFDRTAPR